LRHHPGAKQLRVDGAVQLRDAFDVLAIVVFEGVRIDVRDGSLRWQR